MRSLHGNEDLEDVELLLASHRNPEGVEKLCDDDIWIAATAATMHVCKDKSLVEDKEGEEHKTTKTAIWIENTSEKVEAEVVDLKGILCNRSGTELNQVDYAMSQSVQM